MMEKKVTDLEYFCLHQVFRPYQNMIGLGDNAINTLPMPIDNVPQFAKENPEWWKVVSDRIHRCGFWFPSYIKHKIVSILRKERG